MMAVCCLCTAQIIPGRTCLQSLNGRAYQWLLILAAAHMKKDHLCGPNYLRRDEARSCPTKPKVTWGCGPAAPAFSGCHSNRARSNCCTSTPLCICSAEIG